MTVQNRELIDKIEGNTKFKNSQNLITAFYAGSAQTGTFIEGLSDLDIAGIYIEPPQSVLCLNFSNETGYVETTNNREGRNTNEDTDVTFKTLKEWASLAANGNPTQLGVLFSKDHLCDPALFDSVWYTDVKPNAYLFSARSHANAFLGYGESQLKRMQGIKGAGKHGQRPDLAAKLGLDYDPKAAMHMIRMMREGLEFVESGKITYPRPEVDELLDIRNGKWTRDRIISHYLKLEGRLKTAKEESHLPEKTDSKAINAMLSNAYLKHWDKKGLLKTQ
jgi:predicted nucleotidyltransferase